MNVITPLPKFHGLVNRALLWILQTFNISLRGLEVLSLIHYARWVIISDKQFPRPGGTEEQPREKLKYAYMLFFSNFNGSWDQYVDSFTMAIPTGLDFLWRKNSGYPKSLPMQPFHRYITRNQIVTEHYYNAYPLASSNDIKAGKKVLERLRDFQGQTPRDEESADFKQRFDAMLLELQNDLGQIAPTPIVSLSAAAVTERKKAMSAGSKKGAKAVAGSGAQERAS